MADVDTTGVPGGSDNTAATDSGFSVEELKSLIGDVFDERTKNSNYASKDDLVSMRVGIIDDLAARMKGQTTTPADTTKRLSDEDLLKKVGELIDGKIGDFKIGSERQPGKLGRWLLGV